MGKSRYLTLHSSLWLIIDMKGILLVQGLSGTIFTHYTRHMLGIIPEDYLWEKTKLELRLETVPKTEPTLWSALRLREQLTTAALLYVNGVFTLKRCQLERHGFMICKCQLHLLFKEQKVSSWKISNNRVI